MDEQRVRKALGALEGLEHQRHAAMEILVRHLTDETAGCEDVISQLLEVLDNREAVADIRRADAARADLAQELSEAKRERPLFTQLSRR